VCGECRAGFNFIETGGHVGGCVGFGADRVEIGGDVRVAGVEGDVFVAGAFVDGEGDEGGRHSVVVSLIWDWLERVRGDECTFGVFVAVKLVVELLIDGLNG
jgi:hypothetical protein